MGRGLGVLARRKHLLVELLPGPQAGVGDLDLLAGAESGQLDHPARQVGNAYRLAHVEDEDLVARGDRRRLHHQPAGLGNGHEEARDGGVRDRHRAAPLDLFAETGDDRAVRPQNVAEARRDELRTPADPPAADGLPERLDIDLGHALRSPHHIGRVHGLVGRDHHHLLHAVAQAEVGDIARSGDVGQHRLAGILLHERHVLVGRSVEDDLRTVGRKCVVEPLGHADIADHRGEGQTGMALLEFEADVVHRRLGIVEEHEPPHAEAGQLRTDRAGSARDENRPSAHPFADLVERDADLGPAQQVLDTDLAHDLLHQPAVGHLVDRRSHKHADPRLGAVFHQPFAFVAGRGRRRKQHGVDAPLAHQIGDARPVLEIADRPLGDRIALELPPISQKARNTVVGRMLQAHREGDLLVAGAVNKRPKPIAPAAAQGHRGPAS